MLTTLIKRISNFSSLVKISHTIFSLPFAVIGFFLAAKTPDAQFDYIKFILIILAVFFARNSAMSFNRIIDRKYDKLNPRTQTRDIPSGNIPIKNAIIFLIINILAFIIIAYLINRLCLYLSPVALAVILGYSFTKRFTFLSHFVLGLSLSLAPIGAYLAVTANFQILPVLYSLAVLFWVSGFDIIYALHDTSFDKKQGLHSIPASFGIYKALVISIVLHFFTLILIISAGILNHNGLLFWIGVLIFSFFLFYQHLIVKPKDTSRINLAFFTMNGFSGLFFLLFFILDFYFSV